MHNHYSSLMLTQRQVARTRHASQLYQTGSLSTIGHLSSVAPTPPDTPPRWAPSSNAPAIYPDFFNLRHDAWTQNTMDPAKMGKRRNRAVMLHALANIEQWAIDLAWDILARFGPTHRPALPPAFFADFVRVAADEAKHFSLLRARLEDMGASSVLRSVAGRADRLSFQV